MSSAFLIPSDSANANAPLEVDPDDLPRDMEPIYQAEAIDLSDCNLPHTPEWLLECKNLRWLNLGGNRLSTLPRWLSELPQLESLKLKWNHIEHVPGWVGDIPHLRELDLEHNPVAKLENLTHLHTLSLADNRSGKMPVIVGDLPELGALDISRNALPRIPEWVCSADRLKLLNAGANRLMELPQWMRQFTQLEELDLTDNRFLRFPEWLQTFVRITKLHIGNNNLIDNEPPDWIEACTHLVELGFGSSRLRYLPRWLCHLPHLQSLQLRHSQHLTLPGWLVDCRHLEELDLYGCHLEDLPREYAAFIKMKRLSLGHNNLTALPGWMREFTRLQELDLSMNRLTSLPDWIWDFHQLRQLDLSNTGAISLSPKIGQLKKLQHLNLDDLRLGSVPKELGELPLLTSLRLDRNNLHTLPSEIRHLSHLRELSVAGNSLSSLPSWLSDLHQLRDLDVSFNKLSQLLDSMGGLRKLWSLDASQNPLSTLPVSIKALPRLRSLAFTSMRGCDLPPWFNQLTGLEHLSLRNSHFDTVPESLRNLVNLETLNLDNSGLKRLPDWLGDLKKLRHLKLSHNVLKHLPEALTKLPLLQDLDLRANRELDLPPEFTNRFNYGQAQEILNYYFRTRIEAGGTPLREVKLLVVGEGEVGKTSLIKQLLGEVNGAGFDKREKKTEGIERHKMLLACEEKGEVTLNIWDFGGQEIMHSTHQFFLTERSIYLLVLDSRHNEGQSRVEYWLKLIQSFGGNSPVIIVCNKCDQQPMQLNWHGLQEKYPQIKHYARLVSCFEDKTTREDKRQGLDELRTLIARTVAENVAHVDTPFRPEWLDLKTKLEHDKRDVLTEAQFERACGTCAVAEEDRKFLLHFLHDLGLVLHFGDHALMKDTHVLDPGWVTAAVYRLLNDHPLNQRHGLLEYPYFVEVLKKVDGYKYVQHESFIWEMMKRFQLGFEFEAPGRKEPGMLIPDLLQKEEGYRGEWSNSLAFIYKYTVLPQAVVSRFIVAMHRHIKPNSAWRYGAILERDGCQARVKADLEDHVLEIQVMGPEASLRSFLEVIREVLDSIHEGFSEKLGAQEFVPVPGHPGKREPYRKLLQMERDGKAEVYIEDVGDVPLSQLLNGIAPARRREDLEGARQQRRARAPAEPDPTPVPQPTTSTPQPTTPLASLPLSTTPWWVWSLVTGLVAGGVALAMWYIPSTPIRVFLGITALVTVWMINRDPLHYYRKWAATCIAGFFVVNSFGISLDATYQDSARQGGVKWNGTLSTTFNIALVAITITLLVLDYKNRRASKS